jgi:hypothetical protein
MALPSTPPPGTSFHAGDAGARRCHLVPHHRVSHHRCDGPRSRGRFWAINYFFPGDAEQIDPAPDSLAEEYGEGPTHTRFTTVERLVEFQYTDTGILRTATAPIQLQLIDDDHSRNWEGLARLEGQGFLIVTDKHPETILGFVAYTE